MGDRGQVQLNSSEENSPSIYLYTHWGAQSLEYTVANALARGRGRWNDEEYLNRIIFSEMIQGDVFGETGYGIGLGIHGDIWKLVVINHADHTVGVKEVSYENVDFTDYNPDDVQWLWVQECIPYELFIAEHADLALSIKE